MSKLSLDQHTALNALWKLNYKEVQEVIEVLEEQHDEYSAYCGDCGMPCSPVKINTGIGPYEFQGQRGYDSKIEILADCCEADVFTNWELTVNFGRWDLSPEEY